MSRLDTQVFWLVFLVLLLKLLTAKWRGLPLHTPFISKG